MDDEQCVVHPSAVCPVHAVQTSKSVTQRRQEYRQGMYGLSSVATNIEVTLMKCNQLTCDLSQSVTPLYLHI